MKKGVAAALFVVVVMAALAHETVAVTCTATELISCLGPITTGEAPSAECCAKLKEQQPCFCQYINNPQYKPYFDSPNAKKLADACKVTIPTNC
ncbi:non-specific lipid-transfer protein 2-like [Salvia miltiorrhiza]|uniref:non-specific lipid-transfer protein 2-like n=1 Tax=Salvia miltiorrhiza TaxID=226208 RepID=UPI0025AC293E|nr:non-specific lipid-transfer protein 2-like [Salvia miltiorrhiza]